MSGDTAQVWKVQRLAFITMLTIYFRGLELYTAKVNFIIMQHDVL
jgi:hypothetical protein